MRPNVKCKAPVVFILVSALCLGWVARTVAQSLEFQFSFGGPGKVSCPNANPLGALPGEFNCPQGVDTDATGRIFVADTFNDRIQVFDPGGTFLFSLGSFGSGPGQFSFPSDVAADATGRIFVADTFNNRVQAFDATGGFLFSFGGSGSGPGQFSFPEDLAVDRTTGRIIVADTLNNRVQVFDAGGFFLFAFGSFGTGPGEFDTPGGIAVGPTGRIFVSDTLNNRVQVFDAGGRFLFAFGSFGTGPGEFNLPAGLAVDATGRIFVADEFNDRVQVFDAGGASLFSAGCQGTGPGLFIVPTDVAVDPSGRIVVTDTFNDRIQVFVFAESRLVVQSVSVSPTSVHVGESFTVLVTVRNAGIADANNVTPQVTPSGAPVTLTSGPVPSSLALRPGDSGSFRFTFRADAPGTVTFAGGVTGIDASTGATITSCLAPGASAGVTVLAAVAPLLTTTATVSPAPNANGWNNTDVTVTLSATAPPGVRVQEIQVSLAGAQGGTAVVSGNVASVLISAEGTTTLTFFARDSAGQQEASKTLLVRIDKTPPTMTCTVSPSTLWPPNHKLVPVTASVAVSDSLSGPAGFTLTSATSNEPDEGLGDGDRPNDIQGFSLGQPSTSVLLRAERSGRGSGRVYTLTYTGRDSAENSASCSLTVRVPHDQKAMKGKKP